MLGLTWTYCYSRGQAPWVSRLNCPNITNTSVEIIAETHPLRLHLKNLQSTDPQCAFLVFPYNHESGYLQLFLSMYKKSPFYLLQLDETSFTLLHFAGLGCLSPFHFASPLLEELDVGAHFLLTFQDKSSCTWKTPAMVILRNGEGRIYLQPWKSLALDTNWKFIVLLLNYCGVEK